MNKFSSKSIELIEKSFMEKFINIRGCNNQKRKSMVFVMSGLTSTGEPSYRCVNHCLDPRSKGISNPGQETHLLRIPKKQQHAVYHERSLTGHGPTVKQSLPGHPTMARQNKNCGTRKVGALAD
jgi:hypothetical protein